MNIIDHPSPNHSPRKPGVRVDTIVIHHTASDVDRPTIEWLCSPTSGVSAHYVVGTKGAVVRLVDEVRKAWHAGIGRLPWETGPFTTTSGKISREGYDFNHRSIGIEVVNPGDGKTPFTEAQYAALCWLVPDIITRMGDDLDVCLRTEWVHPELALVSPVPLHPVYVLGHRDVAPGRKTDPADNFDWGRIRRALEEMT